MAQTKVSGITSMPDPSCKKQIQSCIVMDNYLSKFSARISELAKPIRELSKDKVSFNWGPDYSEAFNSIKKEMTNAPIVAYYNPPKITDRCKHQGAGCMPITRRKTHILCK